MTVPTPLIGAVCEYEISEFATNGHAAGLASGDRKS